MSNRRNLFAPSTSAAVQSRNDNAFQAYSSERKSVHFKASWENDRPKSFFVKPSPQDAFQSDSKAHQTIQIKMNRLSESNRGYNISTLHQSEEKENSNLQGRESPENFQKKSLQSRYPPVTDSGQRNKNTDLSPKTIENKYIGISARSTPMFLYSPLPPVGDLDSKEGTNNSSRSKVNLNAQIIIVLSEQEKRRQMQFKRYPKQSSKVTSKPQPQPKFNMLDPIKSSSQFLSSLKEHQRLQNFISSRNESGIVHANKNQKVTKNDFVCTGQQLLDSEIIGKNKQKQTIEKEKMRTAMSFGSQKSKSMTSFMKRSQKGLFKDAVSDILKESMIIKPFLKSIQSSTQIKSPKIKTEKQDSNQFLKYKLPSLNSTPNTNEKIKERFEFSPISREPQIDLNVPVSGTISENEKIENPLIQKDGFQTVFKQREKANFIFNRELKFIRQQKNYKLKQIFKSRVRAKQFRSETFRDQIEKAAFTIEQPQSTRTQATQPDTVLEGAATNFINSSKPKRQKPKAKSVEQETREQQLNEILRTNSYESKSPKSQKNKQKKQEREKRFLPFPDSINGGVQLDLMWDDRARLLQEIVQNTQHQQSAEILYRTAQLKKAMRCASLQDIQNEEKKIVQRVRNQFITRGNFSLLKTIKRREKKPAIQNKLGLKSDSVLVALSSYNQTGEKFVKWNTLREKIENYAPVSKTNPALEVAQLLQEKVDLPDLRTPLKRTRSMVTIGRPTENDKFLASLQTLDYYKVVSNQIAIDVLSKDISPISRKMVKKLSLLRLDTLLQKNSSPTRRENFESSSPPNLKQENYLNSVEIQENDFKLDLKAIHSTSSQDPVKFELTNDALRITESVFFVLARFSTKEIQKIGYKSKCLEVQVFLQKIQIPFWLCKIPKYEQLHKFIYYGNFLKARQFLRRQELNIFNKAVVLAFSNLLEEADKCFDLAIQSILRKNQSQDDVLKAISSPMIIKLRKQDYAGVLTLFDQHYEPESSTSIDNDVNNLRNQLYKVYKFAKNQLKIQQQLIELPPAKLPQPLPRALPKKDVIIQIDSASRVEKTMNTAKEDSKRTAESIDFAFCSGSFVNTMSNKTGSFVAQEVKQSRISHLPARFVNPLKNTTMLNDREDSNSFISFNKLKNSQQFDQQAMFNQNKSPYFQLSLELTPDIVVKNTSDKFLSPMPTDFLSYHSNFKNRQNSSQKSINTSTPGEGSYLHQGPEIFIENLSDASRLSKKSKYQSLQPLIQVEGSSPALIDNISSSPSVSNSSTDKVSQPVLESDEEESRSTINFNPVKIQIILDEDDGDGQKTQLVKRKTDKLTDKKLIEKKLSGLNCQKANSDEAKNIIPCQRIQTNLQIKPLKPKKSQPLDTPKSITISMLSSSSESPSSLSSQIEKSVKLNLNINQDLQLLGNNTLKVSDQAQTAKNQNDDSLSQFFQKLNEQERGMSMQKTKNSNQILEFNQLDGQTGSKKLTSKLASPLHLRIEQIQKQTSDFQTQQRKNLAQVNRFINFLGGNIQMVKYIKQYQNEYKKGFSKRKIRQSINGNTSNRGMKSPPRSAYELYNTTYSDHKFAIRFLLESYKNNKSNFQITYGINQLNNLLSLPGKESKTDQSFQDLAQSKLSAHQAGVSSNDEAQSNLNMPKREESFLFRARGNNKSVSGIAMQQIAAKIQSTNLSQRSAQKQTITVLKLSGDEEGEQEEVDLNELQSFMSTSDNRSFGSFAKEAGVYISQLNEINTDPFEKQCLNEAFNIQNYFHLDGLNLNADIVKRLQQHLSTGKDIKIWQTEEPKLHKILGVDYQTIAQARFLMKTLRKATEDQSFGSQPSSASMLNEDSIGDYINDSHEVFVHKYRNAAVEGVDVRCKANDSDIFGEKLLDQMKLIHEEIGQKLDKFDTNNLFNTSKQNTQTKWRSQK